MTEAAELKPIQDGVFWEVEEVLDLRDDFQKLLDVSKRAARDAPGLKEGCLELVEKYRLHEVLKIERQPGAVRLTLANLWRLTRREDRPGLILHTFDLAEGSWHEQDPAAITWRYYVNFKDGRVAAIQFLVQSERSVRLVWPDLEIVNYLSNPGRPDLYSSLLGALVGNLLYALDDVRGERSVRSFCASCFRRSVQLPYKLPAQAISSALHRHICRDEELLRLLEPLHINSDRQIRLSHYLAARPHKRGLARLNRESPDFLPLLNLIPPAWWARRDLLRDKVLRAASPAFQNISPAGLRWLRKAPAEILGGLHSHLSELHWHLEVEIRRICYLELPISIIKETAEVMAELFPRSLNEFGEYSHDLVFEAVWDLLEMLCMWMGDGYSAADRRLVRLLARHVLKTAADNRRGRADLELEDCHELYIIRYIREKTEVFDWYETEGRQRGLPDKNSTWLSLKRRSDKWHEEVWQRKMAEGENVAWESLLGETAIDGIKITPLVSGLDLYLEGREMRHCVSSYVQRCLKEGFRIFSLVEPGGERSTLSLVPQKGGMFVIDQLNGPYNGRVSPAASKAALELCRLYTLKHMEAAALPPAAAA